MSGGQLALVVADAGGGFDVVDARDGLSFAWRGQLGDAGGVAAFVNSTYPAGSVAPARDSLAHEVAMWRIGGDTPLPLSRVDTRGMIPAGVDDRPALWKPGGGR